MLGELLITAGAIERDQLEVALAEQKNWGGPLGAALVRMGMLDEHTLIRALAGQLKLPVMKLEASLARNSAAWAISTGRPSRPKRCLAPSAPRAAPMSPKRRVRRSVSTAPGESVLTRTFCAAWSAAITFANWMSPPLEAQ